MNDRKTETEAIWNELKTSIETLVGSIGGLYQAAGSTRNCRQINELWHPEKAGIGLGFVPEEVRERLETLIIQQGLHLHKVNGPLGKNAYFSLLYDKQLTAERMTHLADTIDKEIKTFKNTAPVAKGALAAELILATEIARMDGMPAELASKPKNLPKEVAELVDQFNRIAVGLNEAQALELLAGAIPFFNLRQDMVDELLRACEELQGVSAKTSIR